jgi:hypothetical protein
MYTPLIGTIYSYRGPLKNDIYIGQTTNFKRRHKDHFKSGKTFADKRLQEIGIDNIKVVILHEKCFDNHINHADNIRECQKWLNELEKSEIILHDSYINGLNSTQGGQHDNKGDAYLEYNYKKSLLWFKVFIKAAKYYVSTTGNKLGFCERTYIITDDHPDDDLKNFKLGEDLHKFRSNPYSTIWSDKSCVDELISVGYTTTSEEAGVNSRKRACESRVNNKWCDIKEILLWLFKKYGHVNFCQKQPNPPDFPNELLEKTNYKNIWQIIVDIRRGCILGNCEKRIKFLESLYFFWSMEDFWEYKFESGMEWYFKNEKYSYPQQAYVIPLRAELPIFMIGLNLGTLFVNRKRTKTFSENILKLIEENKHKPRPTNKDHYINNPEKKEEMVRKQKEKMKNFNYELRSLKRILLFKFEKVCEDQLKFGLNINCSNYFIVSQSHFTYEKKNNNKFFRVNKYSSIIECLKDANTYKLTAFYARKWYTKYKIKLIEDQKLHS